MKHVLLNKDGQVHATIIACPFKYTVPRGMTVYEDNPTMGKLKVDHYDVLQPKPHEDTELQAIDFAVIKDGIVRSVIQWGGAEWCPPVGTTLIPLDKWMGIGDLFDEKNDKFAVHKDRLGKADKDKTVAELQADADAWKLSLEQ